LLNVPVAPSSGFTGGVLQNVGEIRNNGLELSLFGTPITMPNLTWDARLGMSLTKNELVSFGGVRDEPIATGYRGTQRHMEGYPLGVYYGYPVLRDAQGNLVKLANGFAALDSANLTYIGPSAPTRELSLTNTLRIMRNLSLYSLHGLQGRPLRVQHERPDGGLGHGQLACREPEPRPGRLRDPPVELEHAPHREGRLHQAARAVADVLAAADAGAAGPEPVHMSVTLAGRNLATWTSIQRPRSRGQHRGRARLHSRRVELRAADAALGRDVQRELLSASLSKGFCK
jgi:hypothetical protein